MIMRPVVPTLATAPTKNQLLGQFLAASSERRVSLLTARPPGGRRQDARRLAVAGPDPRRVGGQDHAVPGPHACRSADRGAVARLQPAREDDLDRTRSRA